MNIPFMRTSNSIAKPKEQYKWAFLFAFLTACALFIPYIIADKGYFLFYGDFNVQQVPFYKLAHEAVRSGDWGWNFRTDLGANFISSYSFYLLGSPFFWLTIPFPTDFVPHLIGPLLILKFSCASLTAYAYLTRFVKNKDFAVLGGLLYAFSGFSVYNIFFNHFHEAIIYFPLLLLSLELLMKENRRGFFLLMVGLCSISNYYFFFGMVIFVVLYFIVRVMSGDWNLKFKNSLQTRYAMSRLCAIGYEAVLGLLLSAVILLPSILGIISNSRLTSNLVGWNGLLYDKNQRFFYIIQCFFFPPDLPARPVFFTGADAKWSSVAGWLPVFSMTGVIAWLCVKKKTWQKRLFTVCAIIALIPFLNSAFSAFNYSYYARWFYMPILIMVLMTIMSLEDKQINWLSGWAWTAGITAAIVLAIGFFPSGQKDGSFTSYGLYDSKYTDRFWVTCGIAAGGLILMYLLMILMKNSRKVFTRTAISAVCVVSLIYGSYFIGMGKTSSYDSRDYIVPTLLENNHAIQVENADGELMEASKVDDARFDVYEGMDNTLMFFGMRGIQAFQSIVPGSVMDFYNYVGVERTVGSRPESKLYGLRGLLSVKYVIDYAGDNNDFIDESGNVKIPGFKAYSTDPTDGEVVSDKESIQNDYKIFENEYFIPYGFTYDYYMTQTYCDTIDEEDRSAAMLKAMLLSDEQIEKYSSMLSDITNETSAEDMKNSGFSPYNYKSDCKRRAEFSCTDFSTSKSEFNAKITLKRDNLVFFSVPYEEGWSATVDGNPVEIEKVNVGFMAIPVTGDGQEHSIRFTYKTPGVAIGGAVTAGSAVVSIVYVVAWYRIKRKKYSEYAQEEIPSDDTAFTDENDNNLSDESSHFGITDYKLTSIENSSENPADNVKETNIPPVVNKNNPRNMFVPVTPPEEKPAEQPDENDITKLSEEDIQPDADNDENR